MRYSLLLHRYRKGIIFSLISILVIGFLMLLMGGGLVIPLDQDAPVVKARVNTLDRFVQRFPQQVSLVVRMESARAFEQLSQTELSQRAYVEDVQTAFNSCIMNGTVRVVGNPLLQDCGSMPSSTLYPIMEQVTNLSEDALHIDINYSFSSFVITQDNPFQVLVAVNLTYEIGDDVARWNNTVPMQVRMDIIGITDPYTAVELMKLGASGNASDYKFKRTSVSVWNLGNFSQFIANKEYRYESNGTKFLDRYTHTVSRSMCCGIESVVDPAIASAPMLSSVDKQFFESYSYPCNLPENYLYSITGLNPALRLSGESASNYGVLGDATTVC